MNDLHALEDFHVLEEMIGLNAADHICVLYDQTLVERLDEVVAFLAEGIKAGEQAYLVCDDELPLARLSGVFAGYGIDVYEAKERGVLVVQPSERWRQPGPLDTLRKAAQVQSIVEAAFAAGYRGVRFAVDMVWTLAPEISPDDLEAWEHKGNELLSGAPVRAMCLYGRNRLTRQALDAGLRTHPYKLATNRIEANPSYVRQR